MASTSHIKLQQAGVQPLEPAFRHRVEVDARNALLDMRALQPTGRSRARAADSSSAVAGDWRLIRAHERQPRRE